jgi:hypothetical protein
VVEPKDDRAQKNVGQPGAKSFLTQNRDEKGDQVLRKGKAKANHGTIDDAIQHIVEFPAEGEDQADEGDPFGAFLDNGSVDADAGQGCSQALAPQRCDRDVDDEFNKHRQGSRRDRTPEKGQSQQPERFFLVAVEPPDEQDVKDGGDQGSQKRHHEN